MPKPYFDTIVILPLHEELEQFQKVFTFVKDHSEEAEIRLEMRLDDSPLSVLCTLQDDMGKSAAVSACTRLLRWCDAGIVVCLGIAGGISNDLKLGDVAYAGSVLDVYDNSKTTDKDSENIDVQLSPRPYETSREILVACNFVRALPTLKPILDAFNSTTATFRKALSLTQVPGRNGKREDLRQQPRFIQGCIVCGAVSKSVVYNKQLQSLNRRILAIETESGGVFEACSTFATDAMVIRGISDYADGSKKKLEEATGGKIRELAAYNASSFLALQLRSLPFQAELFRRRQRRTGSADQIQFSLPLAKLSEMVSRVDKYLDEYLRAISPLYRTQPAGFKLPVPRVKLRRGTAEIRNRPVEIRDLLEKRERLVIVLPKMYPDQGLPCVIAQDLIKTVISEKQPVPLFIDAKAFSPPQTLDALSPERFEQVLAIDGALPVLVIANVPLSSRTKTLALTKLLNDLVGFKVLVIVSEREIGGSESSFAAYIQAESVSLERSPFVRWHSFCNETSAFLLPSLKLLLYGSIMLLLNSSCPLTLGFLQVFLKILWPLSSKQIGGLSYFSSQSMVS